MLEVADRDDEVSIRDLERQIENLNRDRVRLEDSIKRMETNQVRIFREDASRGKASEQAETLAKPSPCTRKRSRSRSGSAGSEKSAKSAKSAKLPKSPGDETGGKKDDEGGEKKDGEPEKKRRAADRPSGKADPRNRNLFGRLLGHIHSAKTALDREKGTKAAELSQKTQERIEDKLSISKMNIKEFRKAQFANKIEEDKAKVVQIAKSVEEKELLLLQKRLERHYSLMMNFIRTTAEPTIFYLPAKHNRETERALQETRVAINRKLGSLKADLKPIAEDEVAARAAAAAAAADATGTDDGDSKTQKDDNLWEAPEEKEPEAAEEKDEEKDAGEREKKVAQKPEEEKKEAPSDDSEEESAPAPDRKGDGNDS